MFNIFIASLNWPIILMQKENLARELIVCLPPYSFSHVALKLTFWSLINPLPSFDTYDATFVHYSRFAQLHLRVPVVGHGCNFECWVCIGSEISLLQKLLALSSTSWIILVIEDAFMIRCQPTRFGPFCWSCRTSGGSCAHRRIVQLQ